MKADQSLVDEVEAADPKWVLECRQRYLTDQLFELSDEMIKDRELIKSSSGDSKHLVQSAYNDRKRRYDKLHQKLQAHALQAEDRLSELQIQKAREVPMQDLLEVTGKGTAFCPGHDDKQASMVVWDDHVHCFGCGFHANPIGWVMKVRGLSFPEAVRSLLR